MEEWFLGWLGNILLIGQNLAFLGSFGTEDLKRNGLGNGKLSTLGTSPTNPPRDSITFNDQSQSLIQAGTVFQTQLAWASDVPTGTVVLGQSAQIPSNSLDNRAFVFNHGKDHGQFDAPN